LGKGNDGLNRTINQKGKSSKRYERDIKVKERKSIKAMDCGEKNRGGESKSPARKS